ncbi:MAG: EamA family transporter [Chloroflexi bacterium]|nr:EamA family transporter [Chloroflexota bacterium]
MDGIIAGVHRTFIAVNTPSHLRAVAQAFLVTFLWSTSWVLIKIGLTDIPALTFAGLRYVLAFICLLPFAFRSNHLSALKQLSRRRWVGLIGLGLLCYAVTQGTQFVGLAYLPAVTVSLLLTLTAIVVPLLGMFMLAEQPSPRQWIGVGLFLIGVVIFFNPIVLPAGQVFGFAVVLLGVLTNSLTSILGRRINLGWQLDPLIVTVVSMGIGATVLLITGLLIQGLPSLQPIHWGLIAWLAIVNSAFAFTLWNNTLRTLSATESAIINNTMLVQIAILAWIFLGEQLTVNKIIGMLFAMIGAIVVQIKLTHSGR